MELFDFFCKISFFECNRFKTVWDVLHDLKNMKIDENIWKIGQFLHF
jgi:hypothetical protein